jgi:diadenosine tetraphosphate (Ap4A) HIT family hydrolase
VRVSHVLIPQGETTVYLGWLVVEPTRHVPGLGDLTEAEAQRVGLLVSRVSRALQQAEGVEHIYSFVLGHHVPHLHVHVLPRYAGTPREFWGTRVDEWPEAPRGSEETITTLTKRLRSYMASDHQLAGRR